MLASRALALLSASLTVVPGCTIVEPTISEPGLIIFYGDTAQISAPAVAARSVPFEVSVQTFGGGCTQAVAETKTQVSGMVAEIRPYNATRQVAACPDNLRILTHRTTLQFDQVGPATIRVIAEQCPFQGSGAQTGPTELERQIVVR